MVLKELRWRTSEFDGETTPFYAIPCPLELPTDISNTLLLELVRKEDTLEEVGEGIDDKWNWRKDILFIILHYGNHGKSIGIVSNKNCTILRLKVNVIFW